MNTDHVTDNDICLMILYYNYVKLRDHNEPGVITTIIAYKRGKCYDYFPETITVSAILQDLLKQPITSSLSKLDTDILDEVIYQWSLGSEAFDELVAMVIHTKTKVTKNIITLPRILFFACRNKQEYSILLSRLYKIIEDNER